MTQTLLVVDMQKNFGCSLDATTVQAVSREILRARDAGEPIVFFELPYFSIQEPPYDPTHPELKALVEGYEKAVLCPKAPFFNNGARNLRRFHSGVIDPRKFVMTGVLIELCVLDIAMELPNEFPGCEVEVIQDACNTSTDVAAAWAKFAQDAPFAILRATR